MLFGSKFMSCYRAIVKITWRADYFHDYIWHRTVLFYFPGFKFTINAIDLFCSNFYILIVSIIVSFGYGLTFFGIWLVLIFVIFRYLFCFMKFECGRMLPLHLWKTLILVRFHITHFSWPVLQVFSVVCVLFSLTFTYFHHRSLFSDFLL